MKNLLIAVVVVFVATPVMAFEQHDEAIAHNVAQNHILGGFAGYSTVSNDDFSADAQVDQGAVTSAQESIDQNAIAASETGAPLNVTLQSEHYLGHWMGDDKSYTSATPNAEASNSVGISFFQLPDPSYPGKLDINSSDEANSLVLQDASGDSPDVIQEADVSATSNADVDIHGVTPTYTIKPDLRATSDAKLDQSSEISSIPTQTVEQIGSVSAIAEPDPTLYLSPGTEIDTTTNAKADAEGDQSASQTASKPETSLSASEDLVVTSSTLADTMKATALGNQTIGQTSRGKSTEQSATQVESVIGEKGDWFYIVAKQSIDNEVNVKGNNGGYDISDSQTVTTNGDSY